MLKIDIKYLCIKWKNIQKKHMGVHISYWKGRSLLWEKYYKVYQIYSDLEAELPSVGGKVNNWWKIEVQSSREGWLPFESLQGRILDAEKGYRALTRDKKDIDYTLD